MAGRIPAISPGEHSFAFLSGVTGSLLRSGPVTTTSEPVANPQRLIGANAAGVISLFS
jgi:hypothetical protein